MCYFTRFGHIRRTHVAAVMLFNELGIKKKIRDKQVILTSGDLEKLRRFKNVDEIAKRWLARDIT